MQYTVISSGRADPDRALNDLVTEVNRMIEKGWKPLGGVSFCQWSLITPSYHQAMIYDPETNPAERS